MASLFSLFGEIFIENDSANKAIDATVNKAETASTKTGTSFGTVAKNVGVGAVAVASAAAAAVGAVWELGSKTAETADSIDEGSQKLGVSAQGYQEWAYVLDQNGLSIDSFGANMKGLVKTLTDGSAKSSGALDTLGLSLDSLKGMSQEDALNTVTEAFQNLPAGVDKSKLALDVFGKSGLDMLPVLNSASGSLEDMKQKAHDYGMVMSDEAVASGAKLGDSLDTLKMAGQGLMNQLGSSFVPLIQSVVDIILSNMPMIQSTISQLAPILTGLFTSLVPILLQMAQQLLPPILDLINQLLPFLTQFASAILPVMTGLLTTLLPIIVQLVQMILPLLISVITPLIPLLQPIFDLLTPILELTVKLLEPLIQIINLILPPLVDLITMIIQTILPPLTQVVQFLSDTIGSLIDDHMSRMQVSFDNAKSVFVNVGNTIKSAFLPVFQAIQPVIDSVKKGFEKFSSFMSDVFAGNWSKVWKDIQTAFSDVAGGLVEIFKKPINGLVDLLNGFIKSVNKISIPDWVPGFGGKGINLPSIPRLKVGMDYVPADDFPALLHRGETVLTAKEAEAYRADSVSGAKSGNTYAPVFNINVTGTDKTTARELLDLINAEIAARSFGGGQQWTGTLDFG